MHAWLGTQFEAGSSLGHEACRANILILTGSWANWKQLIFASHPSLITKPFKCDARFSSKAGRKRKHHSNDAKCRELGWSGIPLVVESFGCEAQCSL